MDYTQGTENDKIARAKKNMLAFWYDKSRDEFCRSY